MPLRKPRPPGRVMALGLMNYAVIRFFVEFYRGDPGRGYLIRTSSPWTSLSVPQALALAAFVIGLAIFKTRPALTKKGDSQ